MIRKILLIFACLLISLPASAISIKAKHPKRYVVQEGDSLWSIADEFLDKPWEWEKLWKHNPHIKNPDQIYPGAVIEFHNGKGKPYLSMSRRARVKLSPQTHRRELASPIPPVPIELVKPFFNNSLVFDEPIPNSVPYVVGFADDRLIGGDDSHIFVTLLRGGRHQSYSIYRPAGPIRDPNTTQRLGYAGIHIADVKVVKPGEPATVVPSHMNQAIHIGDKLILQHPEKFTLDFYPHAPRLAVDAQVIHIFDGIARAGNNQVVILSRGRLHGLQPGDVVVAIRPGKKVVDPVMKKRWIKLPDEQVAELMVFRTFKRVSFALSMKTWSPLHIKDHVINPA